MLAPNDEEKENTNAKTNAVKAVFSRSKIWFLSKNRFFFIFIFPKKKEFFPKIQL